LDPVDGSGRPTLLAREPTRKLILGAKPQPVFAHKCMFDSTKLVRKQQKEQ